MELLIPLLLKIAPEILGPLLAGGKFGPVLEIVEKVAGQVLGTKDPAEIQAKLSADNAALEHFKAILTTELSELNASLADVQNARAMTLGLAQTGSSLSWGSAVVSVVVAVFGFAIIGYALATGAEGQVAMLIVGSVLTWLGTVVAFWLGSSRGSQMKDAYLAGSAPVVPTGPVALPKPSRR